MLDHLSPLLYYIEVGKRPAHMEQYRSGHNGHDWKSCVPQKGTEGSNPSCSARVRSTSLRMCFFYFVIMESRIESSKIQLAGAICCRQFIKRGQSYITPNRRAIKSHADIWIEHIDWENNNTNKNQLTFLNFTDIIFKLYYASVAQSVVHLTRNEKVACSSHVTSSKKRRRIRILRLFY